MTTVTDIGFDRIQGEYAVILAELVAKNNEIGAIVERLAALDQRARRQFGIDEDAVAATAWDDFQERSGSNAAWDEFLNQP